jgi:hypothetical protein
MSAASEPWLNRTEPVPSFALLLGGCITSAGDPDCVGLLVDERLLVAEGAAAFEGESVPVTLGVRVPELDSVDSAVCVCDGDADSVWVGDAVCV